VSSPYNLGALWNPRARPNVKSRGDFIPAATMREIPLPARVVFSRVILLRSNLVGELPVGVVHLFKHDGDASLSLEHDLDVGNDPLRASLSDRPRDAPIDEVLGNGVSGLVGLSNDRLLLWHKVFVDGIDNCSSVSGVSIGLGSLISSALRPRSSLESEPELSACVLEPEDEPCPAASFASFFCV
jgi:hypothetical protein